MNETPEEVRKQRDQLLEAIRWALGEVGSFPIVDGPPYYRWRTELRLRSGVRFDAEAGHSVLGSVREEKL